MKAINELKNLSITELASKILFLLMILAAIFGAFAGPTLGGGWFVSFYALAVFIGIVLAIRRDAKNKLI